MIVIACAVTCILSGGLVGLWSRDAFGKSVLTCKGKRPSEMPASDVDLATGHFIKGHLYGALALACAILRDPGRCPAGSRTLTGPVVATLALTAVELDALTQLAGKGRVLMDVDPAFQRRPAHRRAARSVLTALRRANALQKA